MPLFSPVTLFLWSVFHTKISKIQVRLHYSPTNIFLRSPLYIFKTFLRHTRPFKFDTHNTPCSLRPLDIVTFPHSWIPSSPLYLRGTLLFFHMSVYALCFLQTLSWILQASSCLTFKNCSSLYNCLSFFTLDFELLGNRDCCLIWYLA